jgi:hypothetical protein
MEKNAGSLKVYPRTILTHDNVQYNKETVNESLFTTRYLEKGL